MARAQQSPGNVLRRASQTGHNVALPALQREAAQRNLDWFEFWLISGSLRASRSIPKQVAEADALLIASPEYARGVPGSLKNALDWLAGSTDVVAKPVALLNGSPRATQAQESLAVILRTISAKPISEQPYLAPVLGKSLRADDITRDPVLEDFGPAR